MGLPSAATHASTRVIEQVHGILGPRRSPLRAGRRPPHLSRPRSRGKRRRPIDFHAWGRAQTMISL